MKSIRVANFNTTGSVAVSTANVVTGFTGYASSGTGGNNAFFTYNLTKATSMFKEAIVGNVENGNTFYQPEATFVINKLQTQVRNQLALMSQSQLVAIAEDRNGRYWLLGIDNALDMLTGSQDSGTAFGDRNGYTFTLTGMETRPMLEVSGSLLATITSTTTMIGG
jgi:hypothetical protein